MRRLLFIPILLILISTSSFAASNHLANEKSRYLLDHAGNPVDWRPWGEEAFEKARREDKPIFLSIGYASCHWCHVMERESFENRAVAELLNTSFVPVLVDREERPEVDATYMTFVEAMTGGGGWPANLVITADRKPLVGATYMPPEALSRLLVAVSNQWHDGRDTLLQSSDQMIEVVRSMNAADKAAADAPGAPVLDATFEQIRTAYDAEHGGFGTGGPKFPQPLLVDFLLRYGQRTGNETARTVALKTLDAMARGSIYDQIGGGFYRYTTDADWRVPHYEKMLYDQALNAIAYTEAWQVTHDERYAAVVRGTLACVLRDMRQQNGAFDSGLDADSPSMKEGTKEQVEGAVYFWTPAEIASVIGTKDAGVIAYYYGIDGDSKLPYLAHSASETREKFGRTKAELDNTLTAARRKLLAYRERRPQPARDDKVVTGWNGLMISALARAGAALDEPRYTEAAAQAAAFVEARLYDAKAKKLYRRFRGGSAGIDALPEDYAMLIQGLLDAYEASFDIRLLDFAVDLQQRFDERFWSGKDGRYVSTGAPVAGVISEADSPIPTANSLAVGNLLRLGEITDSAAWRARALMILRSYGGRMSSSPVELVQLVSALSSTLTPQKQIVLAGDPRKPGTRALLRVVNERFLPNRILLLADSGPSQKRLGHWLPFVAAMKPIGGQPTAYICEHYTCKLPTSDLKEVAKLLQ
jgi:uncharacterized protein YyaL (SSP411 family)